MKTLLVHCSIYIWLLSLALKAAEHLLNARNMRKNGQRDGAKKAEIAAI